jgi:hypothetical protein
MEKGSMRGRRGYVSDRVFGIAIGVLLGLAIILLFLFLGSRSTIDAPSISGSPAQTVPTQTAPPPR